MNILTRKRAIHKYMLMRKFCLYLFIMFLSLNANAQSLVFSQYYFSPPNINPSLASLEKDLFLGVNYRSQWRDLAIPYNTTLFSAIFPVFATKPTLQHLGGFALSLSKETAGMEISYESVRGHFSGAYNLYLDVQKKNLLAMGIQGGFVQKKLDALYLQWGSQYNPIIGYDPTMSSSQVEVHNKITYPTFSAGATWYHTQAGYQAEKKMKSFAGFSVANLNRPDYSMFTESITKVPLIYSFQGGVTYNIQSRLNITHSLITMMAEKTYQINFGTYVIYSITSPYNNEGISLKLLSGAWYRLEDAIILSAGLQAKQLTVAMSIDCNNSKVFENTLKGSAYEISISYRIAKKKSRKHYAIPLI